MGRWSDGVCVSNRASVGDNDWQIAGERWVVCERGSWLVGAWCGSWGRSCWSLCCDNDVLVVRVIGKGPEVVQVIVNFSNFTGGGR